MYPDGQTVYVQVVIIERTVYLFTNCYSRWSITLTLSSELRIIYSLLLYRGNWITINRGIGLTVSSESFIHLFLYRGNLITIYHIRGAMITAYIRAW